MKQVRQANKICINRVAGSLKDARFYVALLLFFVMIFSMVSPIRDMALQTGYRSAPWVFPFVVQNYFIQMIVMLGFVLLFCDAPFQTEESPYMIVRTGRRVWLSGQIMYIVCISFVFTFAIVLVTVLPLLPYIYVKNEWGRLLGTLAQTDAAVMMGTIKLDYSLQLNYTPVAAIGSAFGLVWLNGILAGVLIMFFNLILKRIAGTIAGGILAFMPYVAIGFSNLRIIRYFAPPSWMNIMAFQAGQVSYLPGAGYCIGFIAVLIIVLIIGCDFVFMRKTIEVNPSI